MRALPALLVLAAACGHSEPFGTPPTGSDGPFADAIPARMTYNSLTDSAASLTSDGQGILYLYTGSANGDRCIGLLPSSGGTQRWNYCDPRAVAVDSSKSFSAPALAADGRLIYLQALSVRGRITPDRTTLWLADTANPFLRRALVSLPTNLGGRGVSWLTDARWVGNDGFVARAGLLNVTQGCGGCPTDTSVVTTGLVRGVISATGATMSFVPGADDLEHYALAEEGTSVVFSRASSTIFRVATTGGIAVAVGTLPTGGTVTGIDCRLSDCLVTQRGITPPGVAPLTRFYRVRLATNTVDFVSSVSGTWAGPVILPTGGDVVMQSSSGPTRDLYLYRALMP